MTHRPLRVALVEPYLGGSHRAWAEGFERHSRHDIEVFGLPAIHWKWRMQGAHISLASQIRQAVTERGAFDVLLATSMTNVPALLGQARHELTHARAVLYMHENQLTFPLSPNDEPDLTYAMLNWTSMAAADLVVFNSRFHRDAWFDELPRFLGRFPDHRHTSLIEAVRGRSVVRPVGADLQALLAIPREVGQRPLVLWNQRWEYDKGPVEFAAAISEIVDDGMDFDVAVAGHRPNEAPPELAALASALGDRLVHNGYASPAGYRSLLRRSNIVVSTAQHEFFGVAVSEAVAAGAFPVLPNRLVYPERIPAEHHATCLYDDGGLVEKLRWALMHPDETRAIATALAPTMMECDWSTQAPLLDLLLVT